MNEETKTRLKEMVDAKPIPNPCPMMESFGYMYRYRKGMVDKTPHYTRVEEDAIIYESEKYIVQFNLASYSVVMIMKDDNAEFYGGKPTMFFDESFFKCINEVIDKLGWNESE